MAFELGVEIITGLNMTLEKSVSYHSVNRRFGLNKHTDSFSLKLQP